MLRSITQSRMFVSFHQQQAQLFYCACVLKGTALPLHYSIVEENVAQAQVTLSSACERHRLPKMSKLLTHGVTHRAHHVAISDERGGIPLSHMQLLPCALLFLGSWSGFLKMLKSTVEKTSCSTLKDSTPSGCKSKQSITNFSQRQMEGLPNRSLRAQIRRFSRRLRMCFQWNKYILRDTFQSKTVGFVRFGIQTLQNIANPLQGFASKFQ